MKIVNLSDLRFKCDNSLGIVWAVEVFEGLLAKLWRTLVDARSPWYHGLCTHECLGPAGPSRPGGLHESRGTDGIALSRLSYEVPTIRQGATPAALKFSLSLSHGYIRCRRSTLATVLFFLPGLNARRSHDKLRRGRGSLVSVTD